MSPVDERIAELRRLLWKVSDGDATADDIRRIEQLVVDDAEVRQFYVHYSHLCGALRWSNAGGTQDEVVAKMRALLAPGVDTSAPAEPPAEESPAPVASPILGFLGSCAEQAEQFFVRPTPLSVVTAIVTVCSVLVVLGLLTVPVYQRWQQRHAAPAAPEFLASVTRTLDAQWANDGAPSVGKHRLAQGSDVELTAGLAEIMFDNGVRLTLQGPVQLTLNSLDAVELKKGRATAHVPPQAIGFTLDTLAATVVDLGTEFGANASDDQSTLVRVFDGRIEVETKDADGSGIGPKRVLVAGEVMRFEQGGQAVAVDIEQEDEPFARTLPWRSYREAVLADRPLFYWSFDEADGPVAELVAGQPHQRLMPGGAARRTAHAEIGSGLALGRAADFTGEFGCFAAELGSAALSGAWAVEFWIQIDRGGADQRPQYVVHTNPGASNSNNPAVVFNLFEGPGDDLVLFCKNEQRRDDKPWTTGGPIISDGRWHHVLMVYYGDESGYGVADRFMAFFDGRPLRDSHRNAFIADFKVDRLLVGAARERGVNRFWGRFDELAVYDLSGLSEQQITVRAAGMARRHVAAARVEVR